jgi:hypothetical protein
MPTFFGYTALIKNSARKKMSKDRLISEDWQILLSMLPAGWRELARETQALNRKPRNFKDEETILRLFFLHFANGYSLRETVTRAKITHLANVTDVALLKRLRCSENWLKELCMKLLREKGTLLEISESKTICLRLVDGSIVKEPGKTGSQWRIHYSIKLPNLECDYFKLTSAKGSETGESFKQFPVKRGDCIVGDRGYSTSKGIAYLSQCGAYSLVRINSSTLNFYKDTGEEFTILTEIADLTTAFQANEFAVKLKIEDNEFLDGRLCVIRKSEASAEIAIKKILKEANKRQRIVKLETLEYAKYIMVFTTLPVEEFSLSIVLEWYRLRWQIELAIKRLKSLVSMGHLPKYDEKSSKAWLYGKLLIGLLTEKLMSYSSSISPCGYFI